MKRVMNKWIGFDIFKLKSALEDIPVGVMIVGSLAKVIKKL